MLIKIPFPSNAGSYPRKTALSSKTYYRTFVVFINGYYYKTNRRNLGFYDRAS